jgi:hypothetical protein
MGNWEADAWLVWVCTGGTQGSLTTKPVSGRSPAWVACALASLLCSVSFWSLHFKFCLQEDSEGLWGLRNFRYGEEYRRPVLPVERVRSGFRILGLEPQLCQSLSAFMSSQNSLSFNFLICKVRMVIISCSHLAEKCFLRLSLLLGIYQCWSCPNTDHNPAGGFRRYPENYKSVAGASMNRQYATLWEHTRTAPNPAKCWRLP